MTSSGRTKRDRPAVVRRTARKRPPTEVPTLSAATYLERVPVEPRGRLVMRAAGACVALGAVLVVVSDFLPYVNLNGETVTAATNIWSILAHLLLLAVGVGAGALLITNRGGRVGIALLSGAGAIAPAALLLHLFAGMQPDSHAISEYYFGVLHSTLEMQGLIGRTLALVGWLLILLAAAGGTVAWRAVADRDLLPLDAGRRYAAGAAGMCALLAITAFVVPSALTSIRKYTDKTGLVLTRELTEPRSVIGVAGLGLLAGIALLIGWIAAAALIGSMSSRVVLVAGLTGFAAMLLREAFLNARDITAGPDLAPGPRLYLLFVAGAIAAAAACWAATVRGGGPGGLVSEESDPFS